MTAAPARAWWRRNRLALLAILLLLPLTLGVGFASVWTEVAGVGAPAPLAASGDAEVDHAGATWSYWSQDRIAGDSEAGAEIGVPGGADLLVVTLTIEPTVLDDDDLSVLCTGTLVELRPGAAERSWQDDDVTDHRVADGVGDGCDSGKVRTYRAEFAFLVPEDAVAPFELRIETVTDDPRTISFALPR